MIIDNNKWFYGDIYKIRKSTNWSKSAENDWILLSCLSAILKNNESIIKGVDSLHGSKI